MVRVVRVAAVVALSITLVGSCSGSDDETSSCVGLLHAEFEEQNGMIRQFADYNAARDAGINVDSLGDEFSPDHRGLVFPTATNLRANFGDDLLIPITSMACYVGDPFGEERIRLTTSDLISDLPDGSTQDGDMIRYLADEPAEQPSRGELDLVDELLDRGVITGWSVVLPSDGWVSGTGLAPSESGFELVVVWTHPEGSGVEALALMEKALEGTAGDDELDLDAAALEQADRLIVSTVPIVDRQLGVWRELIAIFDPLMFPNPNS